MLYVAYCHVHYVLPTELAFKTDVQELFRDVCAGVLPQGYCHVSDILVAILERDIAMYRVLPGDGTAPDIRGSPIRARSKLCLKTFRTHALGFTINHYSS